MQETYQQSAQDVLASLHSSPSGLTAEEAAARLDRHGPNKLQEAPKATLLQRFFQQLKDPMLLILMAAAAVSAATNALSGESFTEVFIILAVVLLNAVLGVVQESKAEAAIEALQSMTAATSKVLRDGSVTELESSRLVPGDIVLLEAGDAVPADGRLLACASLQIEEAALTGESVPSAKSPEALTGEVTLGDRRNMAYMGSTVAYGRGRMVVTATGMDTEMGKIAGVLARTEQEETPLQKKLTQLGKTLSWLVLGICVFIFVFDLIVAGDFSLSGILETFMVAVSLAVAAIPEGLATVVTVVLSIGVTRMSRRNAVIRRLTAVETLGCTQVICSDKTGTLTQNKMTVVDHTGDAGQLAAAMALCSDAVQNPDGTVRGEPTEAALVSFAAQCGLPKPRLEQDSPRIAEAPFDSGRKMMSTLHSTPDGVVQYTKGAPDQVLARCTHYWEGGQALPMTDDRRREILADNHRMAAQALRVLAAASRPWPDGAPQDQSPAHLEQELCFIGLTGMIDPVRPQVKPAIEECRQAGIRPVMITGDHQDTAVAIARQLGILSDPSQAITGAALDALSDEELTQNVDRYSVYARVQPEHKVRIVSAWRRRGAVTAMTGDGVNDAPSIKSADIGIGMGITGTDVTKNVADMVLSDDNFATIVGAVAEGRRIYDNIRKAIGFLLASNMSEVLGVFFSALLGFTLLNPVHLLFINLITDCFPALALGMERPEPDIMRRPPRSAKDGIFSGGLGFDIAYQGILITVITMASYIIGHCMEAGCFEMPRGVSPHGMTMAFLTMSMCEIFHSFNMRSQRRSVFTLPGHNKVLWAAMIGSLILTTVVLEVPAVANAFGFTPVGWTEYGIALALAVLLAYGKAWLAEGHIGGVLYLSYRNFATSVLLTALPMPFYLSLRHRGHLATAAVLALALALTGSRSALLFGGILLTLCCVYLMRSGVISRRCLVLLAAAAGIGILALGPALLECVLHSRVGEDIQDSNSDRLQFLARAADDFLRHPVFGIGLCSTRNADVFTGVEGSMVFYHNSLAQVMGSMGLVGIVAYGRLLHDRIALLRQGSRDPFVRILTLSYLGMFLISLCNPGEFCPFPNAALMVMVFAQAEEAVGDVAVPVRQLLARHLGAPAGFLQF